MQSERHSTCHMVGAFINRKLSINIANYIKWLFSHSFHSQVNVKQKDPQIPRDRRMTETWYKYQNFGFRQVGKFFKPIQNMTAKHQLSGI